MSVEYYSYEEMVKNWGYEVLSMEQFGSYQPYQGDYAVLLKNGDQYGWVTIGYGSCSGCDTLEYLSYGGPEGDKRDKEYAEYSETVRNKIRWDSREGLANWLSDEIIQEGKYSWYEDGYREYVSAAVERLRSI